MADYTDWLGPASTDLTDDQRDTFTTAADAYYSQPHHATRDPEDRAVNAAEDDAAMTAILQAVLNERTLEDAAAEERQAREWAERARFEHQAWVRASAALGVPETRIADRTGLARDTVRKRLGK